MVLVSSATNLSCLSSSHSAQTQPIRYNLAWEEDMTGSIHFPHYHLHSNEAIVWNTLFILDQNARIKWPPISRREESSNFMAMKGLQGLASDYAVLRHPTHPSRTRVRRGN